MSMITIGATLVALGAWAGLSATVQDQEEATETAIYIRADVTDLERFAAREMQRYIYLRTGQFVRITSETARTGDVIVIGAFPGRLGPQDYRLFTIKQGPPTDPRGRRRLRIAGGSPVSTLYGVYRVAEHLGVRFQLDGDVIPDRKLENWRVPFLDEVTSPLFELRGIQPFHDFTEGPDWWNSDDYKSYLSQLAKLRMNFLGLHCYPEGGVGPEPLIWIGLPDDVEDDGTVRFSYPSRWASTMGGAWGYASTPTSDFVAGASRIFDRDDYGPVVTEGHRPLPATLEASNEVFNRAGAMLDDVIRHGHALGVKFCVGTETPLTIPQAVQARLRERGLDPADPETVRRLYEGIFTRIARAHGVDYYWLWTPEGWTWSGVSQEAVDATVSDIRLALEALEAVGSPFDFATCGWVLGPPSDRALFDGILPEGAAVSCINRQVGFEPVEPGFALVEGRPQWAIPWMEDDPAMIIPQLWAGRMRRDAADALAYGCTGLMGIHWRTKVLSPNVAALAAAAWDQSGWNPQFGEETEPPSARTTDVHEGGQTADYAANEIAQTGEDRVYQTCRWDVNAYRLAIPNGEYSVTLKFCEVHYGEPGKRVFGITINGQQVVEGLDVFARVGANAPLDLTFDGVRLTDGELTIGFTREVEYPFIAGIVVEGQAPGAEGEAPTPFARRINCGGGAHAGYEADLPAAGTIEGLADRPRDLPVDDFYGDWARAQFGPEAAEWLAAIFSRLDGVSGGGASRESKLPRPANWDRGPGGIVPKRTPWEEEKTRYAFVEEMEALRPSIVGAGNLDRFDYWLNTFRYLRAVGQVGCARGKLDSIIDRINAEPDRQGKLDVCRTEALPVRLELARLWERMMTLQLAVVSTPGEMGTIANLEQHVRRNNEFLSLHDGLLDDLLGPLPEEAEPGLDYFGEPRLFVPTARPDAVEGEQLNIRAIVLDSAPAARVTLHWRPLGGVQEAGERRVESPPAEGQEGGYMSIDLLHIARGVYEGTLGPIDERGLEYYIAATTADGRELIWPPAAPALCHTVVARP